MERWNGIGLMASLGRVHPTITLNILRGRFKSDLQWWALFMERWNGIGLTASLGRVHPTITLTSDASGRWGCGAFLDTGEWFQCEWQGQWPVVHITAKELVPVIIACATWERQWQEQIVLCRCDNAAVVDIIRSGQGHHQGCMNLMRSLSLLAA